MFDLFQDTTTLKVAVKAEAEITISLHARHHDGGVALCHALHALLHLATERGWDFEKGLAFARQFYEEEQIAIKEWETWAARNEQVS
jgi:hypothetical protein